MLFYNRGALCGEQLKRMAGERHPLNILQVFRPLCGRLRSVGIVVAPGANVDKRKLRSIATGLDGENALIVFRADF